MDTPCEAAARTSRILTRQLPPFLDCSARRLASSLAAAMLSALASGAHCGHAVAAWPAKSTSACTSTLALATPEATSSSSRLCDKGSSAPEELEVRLAARLPLVRVNVEVVCGNVNSGCAALLSVSDGTGRAKYEMSEARLVAGLRGTLLVDMVLHGGELETELPEVPSASKLKLRGCTSFGDCLDLECERLLAAAVGLSWAMSAWLAGLARAGVSTSPTLSCGIASTDNSSPIDGLLDALEPECGRRYRCCCCCCCRCCCERRCCSTGSHCFEARRSPRV
mmetsp:Transcript_34824/g.68752  ORF Transcript_34824/g.68752 Transcript_34824/m.68752 type:complete len:281 (+) Transcript_34824:660-1502(+)